MSGRSEGTNNETRELESSEDETPINQVRILSRMLGVQRASVASLPGTSGSGHSASTSAPAPRRTPRQERDRIFWTMLGNSGRSPHGRCRSAAGARIPRPTTIADLLEPDRRLAPGGALSRPTHASPSGFKPSSAYMSFHASLRNLMRKRSQERMDATPAGNGGNPSSGRQAYLWWARRAYEERGERGERGQRGGGGDAPDGSAARDAADTTGTSLGEHNVTASAEVPASVFGSGGANAEDFAGTTRQAAEEPINMSTGALALEEEILEVEGDAPAEPAAPPAPPLDTEVATASTESSHRSRGTKRKREDRVSGDAHESVSALNQSILRLLECPVCMEWMEPPITQCRRGHLVCGACRKRLDTCPVCRTPFSSVRNRAMEDVAGILRYPCRHGCGREVRAARRHKHEASCSARRLACPLPPCRAAPPLPRSKLAQHCQTKHPSAFKSGPVHQVSLPVNCEQHVQWVVSALGALFHVRVDMDVRAWGVLALVAHLGPVNRAPLYTYEVTVTGRHNARRLVYTRATHSDLENSVINTSRQDCFHLTLDQALNYLRFNEHTDTEKTLELTITLAAADAADETVADSG